MYKLLYLTMNIKNENIAEDLFVDDPRKPLQLIRMQVEPFKGLQNVKSTRLDCVNSVFTVKSTKVAMALKNQKITCSSASRET